MGRCRGGKKPIITSAAFAYEYPDISEGLIPLTFCVCLWRARCCCRCCTKPSLIYFSHLLISVATYTFIADKIRAVCLFAVWMDGAGLGHQICTYIDRAVV